MFRNDLLSKFSFEKLFRHLGCALQIAALTLSAVAFAGAQTAAPPPKDNLDPLLDILLSKGILTQQEYDTLKQRMANTAPAPAATPRETAQEKAAQTLAKPASDSTKLVTMMDKGVGVHVGSVDVTISGELNAFYDHDSPDMVAASKGIAGGLASTNNTPSSSVRNGLLPGNFSVSLATKQAGFDVGVTLGFYPGLNNVSGVGGANSAGSPSGLGTTGIDFRQQYLTVSRSDMGTFLLGRNIGFFGQEAILSDISLLGVGSTGGGNIAPSNTSFGRIGIGYVYTDFIPQITYTTPSFAGLKLAAGIFSPMDAVNFTGFSGSLTGHGSPQFQAKATYATPAKKAVTLNLWANFLTQSLEGNSTAEALPIGHSVQANAVDYGGKIGVHGFELLGYGYNGSGLGDVGLFFDAVSPTGLKRDSNGGYFQAIYRIHRVTLGGSYGYSHLGLVANEAPSSLISTNSSEIGQLRYKLTDWISLITEFTHTVAQAHNGNSTNSNSVAAGSILFW